MQSVIFNTLILNSLPIFGILFLDWQSADLILLYGIETLFILVFGSIAICRLSIDCNGAGFLKAFGVCFFLLHFGTGAVIIFFLSLIFYVSAESQAELLWLWIAIAALVWHQFSAIRNADPGPQPIVKVFTIGLVPWTRIIGFLLAFFFVIGKLEECKVSSCWILERFITPGQEVEFINNFFMVTLLTMKIINDLIVDNFQKNKITKSEDAQS